MKTKSYLAIASSLFLLPLLFSSPTNAQSLEMKRKMKDWNQTIESGKETLAENCGKSFEVDLITENWENVSAEQKEYSVGAHCSDGCLYGVQITCNDDLGKEAVASKIDKIVCQLQSEDTPKISLDEKTKTMSCGFSLKKTNFQNDTKAQLEKLL